MRNPGLGHERLSVAPLVQVDVAPHLLGRVVEHDGVLRSLVGAEYLSFVTLAPQAA